MFRHWIAILRESTWTDTLRGGNMYELTLIKKCILCFVLWVHLSFNISNIGNIMDCGATIRLNYTTGEVRCFDKPHKKIPMLLHKAAFMECKNIPSFH